MHIADLLYLVINLPVVGETPAKGKYHTQDTMTKVLEVYKSFHDQVEHQEVSRNH